MYHLLLIDEMVGLVQQSHQLPQAGCPIIQYVTGVLMLGKLHHPCKPVHLGCHCASNNQSRKELLCLLN